LQEQPRRPAVGHHLLVDDVTAAAPLSHDAVFAPVWPEAKVSAKASDQTTRIVARATFKGRSLRPSIRIPSKGLD